MHHHKHHIKHMKSSYIPNYPRVMYIVHDPNYYLGWAMFHLDADYPAEISLITIGSDGGATAQIRSSPTPKAFNSYCLTQVNPHPVTIIRGILAILSGMFNTMNIREAVSHHGKSGIALFFCHAWTWGPPPRIFYANVFNSLVVSLPLLECSLSFSHPEHRRISGSSTLSVYLV